MHAAGAGPAYKDTKSVRKKPDQPGIFYRTALHTGPFCPQACGQDKKKRSPETRDRSFSENCVLFRSLDSGRISSLLGAAGSRRIALHSAAIAGSSLGSNGLGSGSLGSALCGGLLVGIATAAYHSGSSQNDDKRENLFHSVKRLIIRC